jgi:hypothetical protein
MRQCATKPKINTTDVAIIFTGPGEAAPTNVKTNIDNTTENIPTSNKLVNKAVI